jgi:proteasome accessory factor C
VSATAASTERLPRLLSLVPWLRTHPGVTFAEAAEAFGVSERQLRADVSLLFLCGLPGGSPGDLIDIDFEGDHITLLDPQVLDRPLRLTADEGNALLVAVRALSDVPGLTDRDALDRVRGKLETAVGGSTEEQPAVSVALEAPAPDAMLALRRGVDEQRRLHLRYLGAARDEVTERDVDPLRLVLTDGHWYLEAYCHRAEALRLFRADRIQEANVLDVPAAPPPSAVPRDLADGLFKPTPDQLLVELELEPGAQWVADYYPCEFTRLEPDGTLRVALRTPDPAWIRSLVLRLAGRARVIVPAQLAGEVQQLASAAIAQYETAEPSSPPESSPLRGAPAAHKPEPGGTAG